MTRLTRKHLALSLSTLGILGTAWASLDAQKPPVADRGAELAEFQAAPGQSGAQIYEGRVDSLDPKHPSTLYRYERRVRDNGAGLTSTHITRDLDGTVVVVQQAQHTVDYAVTRAELIHRQTGIAASLDVRGQQAVFSLTHDGRTKTTTEAIREPLVAGPTMFGFVVKHWDELAAGKRIPIRFAVLERGESIAFTLDAKTNAEGRLTVRMRPTSWLVRLAVAPTFFEFDSARKVLGYDGRVPPMDTSNGRLKALDAKVTYTFVAPSFR